MANTVTLYTLLLACIVLTCHCDDERKCTKYVGRVATVRMQTSLNPSMMQLQMEMCYQFPWGPDPVSLANYAPWILTVAASTIDRKFVANLVLGDGQILTGIAVNSFDLNGTSYPLMWGGDTVDYTFGFSEAYARICDEEGINLAMIPGKIVMCEGYRQDGSTILLSKGIGCVVVG
ncbi:hypothetical protein SASPL_121055 [Salvia splendens]|uniref:Uncharacterized protein n=1 Tax=Salvia splendens TaxID=180675 RepID=A0A8X8XTM9_SALSN|nr:hypothetical protein SASPL_158133 [Salvia splendens]KAG6418849.1 hypothetical protein SASPL_121055 [Salvia splendens]